MSRTLDSMKTAKFLLKQTSHKSTCAISGQNSFENQVGVTVKILYVNMKRRTCITVLLFLLKQSILFVPKSQQKSQLLVKAKTQ